MPQVGPVAQDALARRLLLLACRMTRLPGRGPDSGRVRDASTGLLSSRRVGASIRSSPVLVVGVTDGRWLLSQLTDDRVGVQQRRISRAEVADSADQRVAVRGALTSPLGSREPGRLALVTRPFGVIAEFRRADQRGIWAGLREDAAAARRSAAAIGVCPAAG